MAGERPSGVRSRRSRGGNGDRDLRLYWYVSYSVDCNCIHLRGNERTYRLFVRPEDRPYE